MKQKPFLLVLLFSMSLLFSCSKSDDAPSTKAVSFDPVAGKEYNGSAVTVTGSGFGTDTSKVTVKLDGKKMVITAITNTSLTFTIPQDFLQSGQKDCTLEIDRPANAVYFINTTTGYIAFNNKILKTTNGGASWNEEFTLKATESVTAISARNGKVWAVGTDGSTQGFIVKYNP